MYRKNVYKILQLILLLFFFTTSIKGVMLTTTNGDKFLGRIIAENSEVITIHYFGDRYDFKGKELTFNKVNIVDINYDQVNESLQIYPMLGGTLGTPGVLNIVFGYNYKKVNIFISGMYYGDNRGIQANLGYTLASNVNLMFTFFTCAGTQYHRALFTDSISKIDYIGGGASLIWSRLLFEFSARYIINPPREVALGLQIGILHRFNR